MTHPDIEATLQATYVRWAVWAVAGALFFASAAALIAMRSLANG